jgi:hypothetical protein
MGERSEGEKVREVKMKSRIEKRQRNAKTKRKKREKEKWQKMKKKLVSKIRLSNKMIKHRKNVIPAMERITSTYM